MSRYIALLLPHRIDFGLRDYGVPGQIGLEPTLADYLATMVAVFREVRRVLRADGTCWLNIGSSYSSSGGVHQSGSYDGGVGRKMSGVRRSGISPHFRNSIEGSMKGRPLIVRNAAAIRVSAQRRDVPLRNDGSPEGVFLSLLGVERVTIKQRDNDFCQVLHTLDMPGDCWIAAPVAFAKRDDTDVEIVLDAVDNVRIVIAEHDADGEAEFAVLRSAGARPGEDHKRTFSIEQPAKPIAKVVRDGEAVGHPVTFDAPLKRFPDIHLVDQSVAFRDRLDAPACTLGHFGVAEAGEQQLSLDLGGRGVQVLLPVAHLYSCNAFGSLIHCAELYDKAERAANALQPKQEMGVPWRLAILLQEDGWILRSPIIWAKPNPMPESVTDRPTSAHEHIFMLSKSKTYYCDMDSVRLPLADASIDRLTQNVEAQNGSGRANGGAKTNGAMKAVVRDYDLAADRFGDGTSASRRMAGGVFLPHSQTANLRNVWMVATQGFDGAHFAVFPPEIPRRCILMGCPPGGTVLDPFLGSGTTLLVADRLGRNGIGIELNPAYAAMAERRIRNDAPMFANVSVA